MKTKFIKYLASFAVLFAFLLPNDIFAACSATGYTVVYVNGINTKSESDTKTDTDLLRNGFVRYANSFNFKDIQFLPGYNPSHISGLGDVAETISQIYDHPFSDYDLDNILLTLYSEISTRKILLVGHSQGTFYTNEIYNYLVNHGVPKGSIGVYNVATPSSAVGGYDVVPEQGAYLTSSNDKVINLVRNLASKLNAKQPLPANIDIPLTSKEAADSFGGHSFSDVYLASDAIRIVSDIENALKKLSAPQIGNSLDAGCFIPPEKDIAYHIQESAFPAIDLFADKFIAANGAVADFGESIGDGTSKVIAQVLDTAKNTIATITGLIKNNAQIPDQKLLAEVSLNSVSSDPISSQSSDKNAPTDAGSAPAVQLAEADQISIDENVLNSPETVAAPEQPTIKEADTIVKEDVLQSADIPTSTQRQLVDTEVVPDSIQKQNIQICSFGSTSPATDQAAKSATHQNLIINEVAWMGSNKSASDEWIELKNISNSELDISGWQILDKGEQIKITIPAGKKIAAKGFLLMERTDDNSVPGVGADIIYTGVLSNSDEGLRLFNDRCDLVDEVLAAGSWPAGDASTKRSMERQADLTWSTYSGSGEGSGDQLIMGTPKKENSVRVISYGGGGGVVSTSSQQPVVNDKQSTASDQQAAPAKILITEVQITGGTGRSNNDFIELYNPNDARVSLKGYRLIKRAENGSSDMSIKSWTSDAFVEAKSFYIWANSDYQDIPSAPDVTTSATLSNDNSIALRYGAENTGNIIDSVGWGSAVNSLVEQSAFSQNPGADQSIQRKIKDGAFVDTDNNAADFELTSCPNPAAQSRSCSVSETTEPNQAPSAFFVFYPAGPEAGEVIDFSAASSTDPDGSIVLYDWDFGDGQGSGAETATSTHSYSLPGNYNILLTIFDNSSASSTYKLPINVSTSSVHESGHVLISEVMSGMGDGRSDEEFVELYNPTDTSIDLTDYELRRKSSVDATSTQILVKKDNFSGTTILPKGFLLIASPEYSASTSADIIYSQYSSPRHLAYDNDGVILYDNFGKNIDEIDYEKNEGGKSLERKALSGGICISAQNDGGFLGNGCDTNNSVNDFEIRDIPGPQNGKSFPEPRVAPMAVSNFSAQYDKADKKIILNWGDSHDYSGAISALKYVIFDASDVPSLSGIETASTTAEFNISEVGRDYKFEIKAIDKDGLGSDISTASVSVPGISIEDLNYLLVNQNNCGGFNHGDVGQVFKPAVSGVLRSISMKMSASVWGHSDVHMYIYKWNGGASSTPNAINKGDLLAESTISDITPTILSYAPEKTWNFSDANEVVLEKEKYYYLEVKNGSSSAYPDYQTTDVRYCAGGNDSLIDGDAWSGSSKINDLYLIINAVKTGEISLQEPIDDQVYYDPNLNYKIKYLEPADKKYSTITIKTSDFLTDADIDDQMINLSDSEQSIGWHEINRSLNTNRAGYFKTKISLSDLISTANNFSVFGVQPPEGKLLYQNSFSTTLSRSSYFSGQVFRPVASGKIDSLDLEVMSTAPDIVQAHAYWSIYEWNGNGNDKDGSAGALLATSTSKYMTATTYSPGPYLVNWDFAGDNEIYLDSAKYYYLTLSIVSDNTTCTFDCRPPMLFMFGSSNGSLIDGRAISSLNDPEDIYLVINKKPEN
ncbi:MAG: lamin tail domain-containing protein [Patescibacteria group bacterium]|nr:lamin tail domain-containing protein [Patescibacteria group bacterium]